MATIIHFPNAEPEKDVKPAPPVEPESAYHYTLTPRDERRRDNMMVFSALEDDQQIEILRIMTEMLKINEQKNPY